MRWLALGPLAVVAACNHAPAPGAPAPTPPRIELVESAPIETPLDDPAIPNADTVWPLMFDSARSTIDLGEFYASDGAPTSRLEPAIHALEAAVRRGVRVRMLVDHSLSAVYPQTLDRLRGLGVRIRALDLGPHGVHHAKYFVVDEREAYVGSQNFDWRSLEHIVELGARVREPRIAKKLAELFALDWATAGGEPPPTVVPARQTRLDLELFGSPPDRLPATLDADLARLVALVDGARAHLRVQLLTIKDDGWDELTGPLRRAVVRGVRVELCVSSWSLRPDTIGTLRELARAGIEVRVISIPQWSGGFIPFARVAHAKYLVVDDDKAGWIGTSNWERDYFHDSRNVALVVTLPEVVAQLRRFSDRQWAYATVFDPDAEYTPPRVK